MTTTATDPAELVRQSTLIPALQKADLTDGAGVCTVCRHDVFTDPGTDRCEHVHRQAQGIEPQSQQQAVTGPEIVPYPTTPRGGYGTERSEEPPDTVPDDSGNDPERYGTDGSSLWDSRPVLAHIRKFALARMCSPAAVLGVVIERTLATIPPAVVLPPVIGGDGSLNLFCALIGPSGDGKGSAETAAADAVRFSEPITIAPLGSGEGIVHCYAHRAKDEDGQSIIEWDRRSVLFSSAEVDSIVAIGDRKGSTLMGQLRSAYSGEQLGFSYADETRKIPLEKHGYRFGLVVGIQPEKAGPIVYDAAGGTPQRFIWLPTTDPQITATPPSEPSPWIAPTIGWDTVPVNVRGRRQLVVPDAVVALVRQQRAARARGEGGALDGHSLFSREKVAVALAVLAGHPGMRIEDWDLAGRIMHLSDLTRSRILATLEAQRQKRDDLEIDRRDDSSRRAWDRQVERVSDTIMRKLGATSEGEIPSAKLRRSLALRDRDAYEVALDRLIAQNQISVEGELGSGAHIRILTDLT